MKLLHLFIPHSTTHQRAPLLHWHFLLIYLLLFILLRVGFDVVSMFKPGILGVNSNITVEKIIAETNQERQKLGLGSLSMNTSLNAAAQAKAQNMFEENYWAHFSPSGKDPWGFILSSGYKFAYAGENLARNFYTSEDTVRAWMNSPSHKENMINGSEGSKVQKALIDPFQVTKGVGMGIIVGIAALLLIDLVVLKRRGVLIFTHHHLAHLSLLALTGTTLITSHGGQIL